MSTVNGKCWRQIVSEITAWVIFGVLIVAGVWDIYATRTAGPESSVSAVIGGWAQRFPAVIFAAGFLAGHLFWPQR